MKIPAALICLSVFSSVILPQNRIVPILDANSNAVLGGVRNGRFVKAQEAIKALRVGDQFTYFGIYSRNLSGKKLVKINKPSEDCSDNITVDIESAETDGVFIGANAGWDPMIRAPDILFDGFQPNWAELKFWNNLNYSKAVNDFLKSRKVRKPEAKITQAFKVDLEGDGTDEVILVASKYSFTVSAIPSENDYSIVLLRKLVGRTVKNILITGILSYGEMPDGSPSLFNVSAIADLDGDEKLEIVIGSREYEGQSTAVYKFSGGSFTKVLGIYCGL